MPARCPHLRSLDRRGFSAGPAPKLQDLYKTLLFAGAGLLKGFALTTIAGITIGAFISRPAYAALVEILLKD